MVNFPAPQIVNDLQRFMAMVNQMGKFLPGLPALNEPLRQLLKKENKWVLVGPQLQAFDKIKAELTSSIILAHHDPGRPIITSCDASNIGIRAVLPCNLLNSLIGDRP